MAKSLYLIRLVNLQTSGSQIIAATHDEKVGRSIIRHLVRKARKENLEVQTKGKDSFEYTYTDPDVFDSWRIHVGMFKQRTVASLEEFKGPKKKDKWHQL